MNRFVRFLRGLNARPNTPAGRARLTLEPLEDRLVPSTVSGVVFNDANNNGTLDSGEAGIAGVVVTLTDASNHKTTTKTDASGAFSFANVAAGTYSLSESSPTGYLNGQATAGTLGGSAGSGVISDIVVGASDGTGYTFGELAKSAGWSAVQSNFNGTAIQAGTTLWFSSDFKINGLGSTPVTLRVTGQTITFAANGTNYDIAVPDSVITFDPTAKTATTTFDTTSNTWRTTLPMQFSGNGFLGGVAVPVTTALPGGINPVTWQGQFTTDTKGISVNWQWATAVYTQFSTDYTTLGVKAVDDNHLSQNSDQAGSPEAFKSFVIGGARGGGGSNYTGSLSGTASVAPPVFNPATQPASVSGYVLDTSGAPLGGVTIDLVNSQGVIVKATTDQFGFYQFLNVTSGTYRLQVEDSNLIASGYAPASSTPGTLGGTSTGQDTLSVSLAAGQNGFNYDFNFTPPFFNPA